MATEIQVETQFNGLEMLFVEAPFDKAKIALEKKGCKLSTAQQVAQARIVAGKDSHVSQYGSWTAENIVYLPNGAVYITSSDFSPILKHASEATEAHRSGNEFYISENELEEIIKTAKEDKKKVPAEQRVYIQKKTESYELPIKKFAKDSLAQFLFKDTAADYAAFLQGAGISEVPVWLVGAEHQKEQKKPFARALWFRDLDGRSGLGGLRGLNYYGGARGVRNASEASKTPKNAGAVNAYESIAQNYVKSPAELQQVLEKYSQIKGLVKE